MCLRARQPLQITLRCHPRQAFASRAFLGTVGKNELLGDRCARKASTWVYLRCGDKWHCTQNDIREHRNFTGQAGVARHRVEEPLDAIVEEEQLHLEELGFVDSAELDALTERFFIEIGAVRTNNGQLFIDNQGFEQMCVKVLKFQLAHSEVIDVFRAMDRDGDGHLSSAEFIEHVRGGRYRVLLCSLLHVFGMHELNAQCAIPETYNFDLPTNDTHFNHGSRDRTFFGPFKDVRESLDFSFHGSYTQARQSWQDQVMCSLMVRSEPKPMPWLVYTCGGYGTGKGFSVAWMSEHGFFPLTDMVCIDPDHVKRVMPEWPEYLLRGQNPGTLCHAESVYMQEILQALAMRRRQNIWIDGSLRDTDWYKGLFQDVRERYPHYRIAIFYIYASEERAKSRIAARCRTTGRGIPAEKITRSHEGARTSVSELTPYVDFVARIDNDGNLPILRSVEVVDRSGAWDAVSKRFAQPTKPADFPRALAPLGLRPLPAEVVRAVHLSPHHRKLRLNISHLYGSANVLPISAAAHLEASLPSTLDLDISSICLVSDDLEMRRMAAIPSTGAVDFCYIYQVQTNEEEDPLRTKSFNKAASYNPREGFPALVELLKYGGFAYFDEEGTVTAVSAISKRHGSGMLQFGPRRPLPEAAHKKLNETNRWRYVSLGRLQAAAEHAWIAPGEILSGSLLGGPNGSFAYVLEDGSAWIFPITPLMQASASRAHAFYARTKNDPSR